MWVCGCWEVLLLAAVWGSCWFAALAVRSAVLLRVLPPTIIESGPGSSLSESLLEMLLESVFLASLFLRFLSLLWLGVSVKDLQSLVNIRDMIISCGLTNLKNKDKRNDKTII